MHNTMNWIVKAVGSQMERNNKGNRCARRARGKYNIIQRWQSWTINKTVDSDKEQRSTSLCLTIRKGALFETSRHSDIIFMQGMLNF